jgi:hypothetical protein
MIGITAMNTESKMMIGLLNGIIPAGTPLTVQTEIQVLELIGLVKDPELVKKMKLLTSIAPASTPATLHGLFQLIGGLMHMSSRATNDNHTSIDEALSILKDMPDVALTYGTFMAICQTLLEFHHQHQPQSHGRHQQK